MSSVTFELKTPIKYAPGNGEEIEANFIELREPTGKIAHLVAILKSEIGAATKNSMDGIELPDDKEQEPSDESTPEEIGDSAFAILMMGGADMSRVMTTFKEILKESGFVGGEKNFTSPMFDRMAYSDIERGLKSYMGNFMAESG